MHDVKVLSHLMNAMPDMIRVLDEDRRVVIINDSYRECFGEQVGYFCYEQFCTNRHCVDCIVDSTIKTGSAKEKRRSFKGKTYWIKASVLSAEFGIERGVVEVFRDITELMLREGALRDQNKRLLREANMVSRMQRTLFLPKEPIKSDLCVHSKYLPASTLGGDLFGCIEGGDGRVCFYVADVSGHGMEAAMLTLMLANEIRYGFKKGESTPLAILSRVQRAFLSVCEDTTRYVTMFIGIIDDNKETFSWVNAGHNAAPLLSDGTKVKCLYEPGLPICDWSDDIRYTVRNDKLEKGGRLFVYTDGLLDARFSSLDESEIIGMLSNADLKGDELLNTLVSKVEGERIDDVCMLLLEKPYENDKNL